MDRTDRKIDTWLARGNRGSFYELIDKDGYLINSAASASQLAEQAKLRWPDQEQDPDRTGKGWDIQIAGAK